MALVDDMAEGIREHKEAFAALNNNEDPGRTDALNAAMMQAYRNLRDLLERYDRGER